MLYSVRLAGGRQVMLDAKTDDEARAEMVARGYTRAGILSGTCGFLEKMLVNGDYRPGLLHTQSNIWYPV